MGKSCSTKSVDGWIRTAVESLIHSSSDSGICCPSCAEAPDSHLKNSDPCPEELTLEYLMGCRDAWPGAGSKYDVKKDPWGKLQGLIGSNWDHNNNVALPRSTLA